MCLPYKTPEKTRVEEVHDVTLDGNIICYDGRMVRIVALTKTRDLRIGCTRITRSALLKLVELSTNCDMNDERVIQP